MRKAVFTNDEFYHVYNRGVDKRTIFESDEDYKRFLLSMRLQNSGNNGLMQNYRDMQRNPKVQPSEIRRLHLGMGKNGKLVDIIAYCLNSNHYHILLKQKKEKGVEKYMQKLGTSYTMYFNKKYERSGALFQGRFKSVYIDSNEYLLYVSTYINANHFIHGGDYNWQYGSLHELYDEKIEKLCDMQSIIDQFSCQKDYEKFVSDHAYAFKERKDMQKFVLE